MNNLTLKYRPTTFDDVIGQEYITKILKKQVADEAIPHCILLSGPSGCGKTTIARIYANAINANQGKPIEIDGASNNGVDNIRMLIDSAKTRALDCKYKVIIIDECQQITKAGWDAFLKCIEEPPMFTVFIFCTTDPQKLPETIKNRLMMFNLVKVDQQLIADRLKTICAKEGYTNFIEVCEYASKLSNGCVRQAIQYIEKTAELSAELSIDNLLAALNLVSYDKLFILVNAIIDKQSQIVVNIIERLWAQGIDITVLCSQFVDFVYELSLFCINRDMNDCAIPSSYTNEVKLATGVCATPQESLAYYTRLLNTLLTIKKDTSESSNAKVTFEGRLLGLCI